MFQCPIRWARSWGFRVFQADLLGGDLVSVPYSLGAFLGHACCSVNATPRAFSFSALFVGRVLGAGWVVTDTNLTFWFQCPIRWARSWGLRGEIPRNKLPGPFQCPIRWARSWGYLRTICPRLSFRFSALFVGRVLGAF